MAKMDWDKLKRLELRESIPYTPRGSRLKEFRKKSENPNKLFVLGILKQLKQYALTDAEQSWLDALTIHFETKGFLSKKQRDILKDIRKRHETLTLTPSKIG